MWKCANAQTRADGRRTVVSMLIVPPRVFLEPAAKALLDPSARRSHEAGWNTSSFANAADTSPQEWVELREHLDRCRASKGVMFSALSLSDTLEEFLAARFVTTLAVVVLAIGALVALL